MRQITAPKATTILICLIAGIVLLMPFHAFLSVGIGSATGMYDAVRVWKEVLILIILLILGFMFWRDRELRRRLQGGPLVWLLAGYVGLHVVMTAISLAAGQVTIKALTYGLIVNLRFIVFFLICAVVASQSAWLRRNWRRLLFIPASLVVVFGLLQTFVLPKDLLAHVGYGPDTILPYQAVDQKPDYARAQSTLRGPNPLGAYLVIVVAGSIVALWKSRASKRWIWAVMLLGALVVLGYSYSRSAYIGALAAAAIICWQIISNTRLRRVFMWAIAGLLVLAAFFIILLRQNDTVQNVLFHTDEYSQSPRSSNQDRLQALNGGLQDLAREPLGRGPGTAGPASVHNDGQVRIAENYYLQIGQEVGWIGLLLFLAVLLTISRELIRQRSEPLALLLFASLVGIGLINLLSHAWADDTLSLIWWGLAGIVAAPAILKIRNEVR